MTATDQSELSKQAITQRSRSTQLFKEPPTCLTDQTLSANQGIQKLFKNFLW
jgi:hypothetical protein